MKLSAKVTIGDQETVILAKPIDILKWETGTKRKITDGMGYGDIMQIVHSAAVRSGMTELSFPDWVSTLDDFEPEAAEPDPTQTVPTVAT